MALNDEFQAAAKDVQTLPQRPDNNTLLDLYSLYKQATAGDVTGSRPGLLDIAGRKKYDAWTAKKGMPKDQAMTQYVALVKRLRG